jgi:adenosine deaminase
MNVQAHLFVSLGTSPAIVPEAFLLPGARFVGVHVLTTERPDVTLIREFFRRHAPGVNLTITRVAGFQDLKSEEDHFRFEEVMFRWFLASRTGPEQRYVCLTGGFKTMSAAMQKAATVLGAAEVFHVLADDCCAGPQGRLMPPSTLEEILWARDQGHLHWIRLGPERGWPQLRRIAPEQFPLQVVEGKGDERRVQAEDRAFGAFLQELLQRASRIAGAWEMLPELPFADLATWSEGELAWLREPLDPRAPADQRWVAGLPKIELHCHLGGFATHGELLRRVRNAAENPGQLPPLEEPRLPEGWPLPAQPIPLAEYMKLGNANGTALLRDPGCLREQCRLLYRHLVDQGVCYAEVRCSPANYATEGRSPWDVLADIRAAFQECMEGARTAPGGLPACHVNLILIATRRASGDYRAAIARHLALAVTAAEHWRDENACRVVGVDLAGYEDEKTRAHYFREEFTAVHRCGLAVTVHAGENDDAEGIWRAVFDLNARRLGHALSLGQSRELLRSVADRGIGVELCPYANLQIKGFRLDGPDRAGSADPPQGEHAPGPYPLLEYLTKGVRVTVNTDNIGISAASLTDNLLLAARLCPGLTRLDLLHLQRHALETAFCTATQRLILLRRISPGIPRP